MFRNPRVLLPCPSLFVGLLLALCLSACAPLPKDYPKQASTALMSPASTRLGAHYQAEEQKRPGLSGLRLLIDNEEAFVARYALIELAQKTIDLQYYIVRDDESTAVLFGRLALAANRGVRVRVLIDDIYIAGRDSQIAAYALHPNIEVRVFNPFRGRGVFGFLRWLEFLGDGERLNRRMHNKALIADNTLAIVGGRNLGNEYFDAEAPISFLDLDVLMTGPVTRQTSRSFDAYWNNEWAIPIEAFAPRVPSNEAINKTWDDLMQKSRGLNRSRYFLRAEAGDLYGRLKRGALGFIWAPARAYWDKPDKVERDGGEDPAAPLLPRLVENLQAAQEEILVISPYFIPGEKVLALARPLLERGVKIKVLTNSLAATDAYIVHAGYAKYREKLLRAGVELYELRALPASVNGGPKEGHLSLHTKAVIVDRRLVLLGSPNIDPRSHLLNTEFAMAVSSPKLADQLATLFEREALPDRSYRVRQDGRRLIWQGEDQGQPVVHRGEPDASFWRQFSTHFLWLFVPEEAL